MSRRERTTSEAEQSATRQASAHIYENVEAVSAVYERAEQDVLPGQRGIERLVNLLGQPRFLFFYLILASIWVAANGLAPRLGATALDGPPFFWLQGVVSATSMFTTIIVLIAQNRQGRLAERRAHLDLQVNLLSERKITKVIALLEELRQDSPTIKDRYDKVAEAMKKPADPLLVVQALEDNENFNPKP